INVNTILGARGPEAAVGVHRPGVVEMMKTRDIDAAAGEPAGETVGRRCIRKCLAAAQVAAPEPDPLAIPGGDKPALPHDHLAVEPRGPVVQAAGVERTARPRLDVGPGKPSGRNGRGRTE